MSSFVSANHLTSWAGLAPKDRKSADKLQSSKTQKSNIYIKSVLVECAWAAVRTRNTRLSNWYWANVKRLGEKKAIIAIARKLLVYIYAMLKNGEMYDGSLDVADTQIRKAGKLESAHKILAHQSNNSNKKKHPENIMQSNLAVVDIDTLNAIHVDTEKSIESTPGLPKKRGRPRKAENSVVLSATT